MYAHFGKGFVNDGHIHPRFRELMTRLSQKKGLFAPVRTVLDTIREQTGQHILTDAERKRLQSKWLAVKLRHGTS